MQPVLYLGCPSAERADTERQLAAADVSVVWAESVPSALDALNQRDMPVLVDLARGSAALQLARDLRARRGPTLMFAVVDARRPDLTTEAVLAGVADVFARPLGGRRIAKAIERELGYESAHGDAVDVRGNIEIALYCQSPAMREVMTLVARAATMRAGVILRGENGTGRHIAARAIHEAQFAGGAAREFVTVDCAEFSGEQLEAELFGAPDGNGRTNRSGLERVALSSRIFAARGGTLYLRNVGDATARVQARLARVLRDREAQQMDTGEVFDLEVRPMAGVDPGFEHAVREGRIRDDLYRRLSVIQIDIPALRNRREDIPALANYLLRDICATLRIPPKTLSRSALALIAALPWRGNVPELGALLENVVANLSAGRGITLEDVLAHVRLDGGSVAFSIGGTLRDARSRFEREYIAAVLEQHRGRISDAARALGIQRTNLYRKMRTLRVRADRRAH
jgi:two-component system nitrogen regulation response regulator NtrX